jgi:hypothetical protein
MTVVIHSSRIDGRVGDTMGVARGVLFVHSCPRAVSPHLEWALAKVFGSDLSIDWADQPIAPNQVRAEIIWSGEPGTGARIASALLAFSGIRYEVTEESRLDAEGERFAATPALGLFRGSIGLHGDVMVHEERLRSLMSQPGLGTHDVMSELGRLIGRPWDDELEAFRIAHEGSTVRVLHQVV